jgi:hypothetical protein
MSSEERLRAAQELQLLLADYWHDVDTNWGRNAASYFTEDGVFEASRSVYRGRAKIDEFYRFRLGRGPRVAVHAFSNFRVAMESPTRAVCTWYLHLYARDGEPILKSEPPIQVALATDTCVKEADGRWRYQYRRFQSLFEGGVATTTMETGERPPSASGAAAR